MATVQYRIEWNPLTKPGTYRLRFLPNKTAGYDEVAARVALKHPGSSPEQVGNHLKSSFDEIVDMLAEGMQVTLKNTLTIRPSFHARLATPDAPLPPMYASPAAKYRRMSVCGFRWITTSRRISSPLICGSSQISGEKSLFRLTALSKRYAFTSRNEGLSRQVIQYSGIESLNYASTFPH